MECSITTWRSTEFFINFRIFFPGSGAKGKKRAQKARKEFKNESDSEDWLDEPGINDSSDDDSKFPDGAKVLIRNNVNTAESEG